jgi:hypothetical protein
MNDKRHIEGNVHFRERQILLRWRSFLTLSVITEAPFVSDFRAAFEI